MLVYLVRHAQSQANALTEKGLNSSLSTLGVRQTQALARRFETIRLDAIYSSPFRRCLETAAPIAVQKELPIRIRPEVWEYHAAAPASSPLDFELASATETAGGFDGAILCPDFADEMKWPAIDESFDNLVRRTRTMANYLKARWTGDDDTVLIIGHGSPTARLIEAWLTDLPGPSFRFVIDNATVSAVRFHRGVSSLVCLNESSHFVGIPAPPTANQTENGAIKTTGRSGPW